MPLFLLLLAVLLLPVPASAADWEKLKERLFYDKDSFKQLPDGHNLVWIQNGSYNDNEGVIITLYEFSCNGQYRMVDGDKWDNNESSQRVVRQIYDSEKTWQYVRPGSDIEIVPKKLCKK